MPAKEIGRKIIVTYQCEECGEEFVYESKLNQNGVMTTPDYCPVCGIEFDD